MKVLVTGATGFLGNWLTRRLVEQDHQVSVLVRKKTDSLEWLGNRVHYVLGDVTDSDSVTNACQNIHTVFHLAGLVAYSRSDRAQMEAVNVVGTQNVVNAVAEKKVTRLVHMSSVVAVGAGFSKDEILNENSEYKLEHLDLGYFETKRKAELIVSMACQKGDVDAVILNPGTVYGSGDARKGSRKVQVKVARGEFPFFTSGGVNVIAVEDVISATIEAWHRGGSGQRYILGGENLLIRDVFKTIAEIAGVKVPWIYLPNPLVRKLGTLGNWMESLGTRGPLSYETSWTSTLFHWFDSSKAKAQLGLNPTPARIAIERSVEWMKSNNMI